MHISEGVLSGPVLAGGWALTAVGTAIGLKRLDYDRLMTVAILSAAFFVASLIHVPIGPVSVHLILNGLVGAILGYAAFPAICVALLLQAVLFQFGGLVVAVLLAGGLTACALALSGEAFFATAKVILVAHIPIMLIEGVLTVMAVAFLAKVRPEMLAIRLSGDGGAGRSHA